MSTTQRSLLTWVECQVRRCRPLALRAFRSPRLRIERKPDNSPVTAADRAVEERLRAAIARACPGEPIIGEEFGASGRPGSTYWTIDPIDGTRAFSRGLPTWCIMVGRVERGQPVLGVCDFPALGTTLLVAPGVVAQEREGNRQRPLKRGRPPPPLREAVLFHGGANWWDRSPYVRGFHRLIGSCYLERAYGDCYGYLWAFRGQADAVIEYGVKIWDMVPLAALAHATGRVMVDVRGRPSWTGPDTIMAAPKLAQVIARTLRERV